MKKSERIVLDTWEKLAHYLHDYTISVDLLNAVIQVQRELGVDMYDALSKGQLSSKVWALENLFKYLDHKDPKIAVCGGWYGTLSALALSHSHYGQFRPTFYSIDIDPNCEIIANKINSRFVRSSTFCAITSDMYDIDYAPYDVVVNTSCEHIHDIEKWLSKLRQGTLVVLQSNNFTSHDEHINCVNSIEEFREKAPLSRIYYAGEMNIPLYTRYLLVGEK
jgi:hypothetical protein